MKIACVYSTFLDKAKSTFDLLNKKYSFSEPQEADIILCLGGDGFMLHSIHKFLHLNVPLYGINCGSLGFLLNNIEITNDLHEIISNSIKFELHPLHASITTSSGNMLEYLAFNEVTFFRSSAVAVHLQITIDNIERMSKLVSDGILVATPMGSTAYNRACGGNILAINSDLMVLTPVNPFLPLNWKGATLKNSHIITITNLHDVDRPLNIACDFNEVRNIKNATVSLLLDKKITLLFDKYDDLENKIIKSQFNH